MKAHRALNELFKRQYDSALPQTERFILIQISGVHKGAGQAQTKDDTETLVDIH
ncbi:hypothetical protein KUIN1_31690 [Pseudomonas sp. KUIN-1]|nr:Uncharacterized protein ABJ98_5535 [Pseudomonas syringae pv. aceris]BBN63979.1 hypothetical protein KUIN1_31690 [Pseudomonas sp. KUIN-1]